MKLREGTDVDDDRSGMSRPAITRRAWPGSWSARRDPLVAQPLPSSRSLAPSRLPARCRRRRWGTGMAIAIALDATLIRLVLVPAAMRLIGRANWWLPASVDRCLPRVSFDHEAPLARSWPQKADEPLGRLTNGRAGRAGLFLWMRDGTLKRDIRPTNRGLSVPEL